MASSIPKGTLVRFFGEDGVVQDAHVQRGPDFCGSSWVADLVVVEDPDPLHRVRSRVPYSANGEPRTWDWTGRMRQPSQH